MTNATDNAEAQARAQLASVVAMVVALDCDFDRLEELRDQKDDEDAEPLTLDEVEELEELEAQANGCSDQEDAERAIDEDPLDVMVRSDWTAPGEELTPSEFMILLCTGGPAVRILGEMNQQGDPGRAWLEFQDWGTPWAHLSGISSDEAEALVRYASRFIVA